MSNKLARDYYTQLHNLLTLWGYEISLRTGDTIRVMRPGVDGSGLAGSRHWDMDQWIRELKAQDEWIARGGDRVRIRRPPAYHALPPGMDIT